MLRAIKRTLPLRTEDKKQELQMVSDYLQIVFSSNGARFTLNGNVAHKRSDTFVTKIPMQRKTILVHDLEDTVRHAVQCVKVHAKSCTRIFSQQSYPYTALDRPLGLQEVQAPRISTQSAHEGDKVVSPTHQPQLQVHLPITQEHRHTPDQ